MTNLCITFKVTNVLPARIKACAASNLRTEGSIIRDQCLHILAEQKPSKNAGRTAF